MISKTQYPEFCAQNSVEKKSEIKVGANIPILPKIKRSFSEAQVKKMQEKSTKKPKRFVWSYDLEAYKKTKACGTQIPFAVGVCYSFDILNFDYQYKDFYGHDSVEQFFDFLADFNPTDKLEVFLYAHNGGKYDAHVLLEFLLKRDDL
jgi:hypothetical protein